MQDAQHFVTEDLTRSGSEPAEDRMTDAHERSAELARRWRVTVAESFETDSSLIAYGHRGTESVVLKVVKRPGDEWRSGEVVNAFGGRGVVRVLDFVDGAALFERVVPGTELVELTKRGHDAAATDILADVISAMSPGDAPSWCPTVSDWGRGFSWYQSLGDDQIPLELVQRAARMYAELCETQGETRLLHGDLQHYNILEDRERGWVAIDPKGVVGEIAYEVGAALRNPGERPDVFASLTTIERRIDVLSTRLRLDAGRLLRWGFAQAVLSAIWHVEDGYVVGADNVPLMLARAIESMLSA